MQLRFDAAIFWDTLHVNGPACTSHVSWNSVHELTRNEVTRKHAASQARVDCECCNCDYTVIPQIFLVDTKHDGLEHVFSFKYGYLWVYMVNFSRI